MKNINQYKGILRVIKRLDSSVNSNPRYLASIGSIEFKTGVDSSYGYSITNYDNKEVIVKLGMHYNTLTLDKIQEA